MADVTLLQQEVILLKLRIAKLEDDKKHLLSDVAVLTAEREQADRAVGDLNVKLQNTEKVCKTMEWKSMAMETRYHNALGKIEQLKSELIDALGSQIDTSSDEEDTPSATSIQEDN